MRTLIDVASAQRLVLERVRPLDAERVTLAEAAGRVLAENAVSTVDLPPFASSAMDGYALRAADAPGPLPVVARIAAGRPADRELRPGEAMAIATGGVLPSGADAVAPVEVVVERDDEIRLTAEVASGRHVRPRGGDVRAGDLVVPAGTRLGAVQLGALAATGLAEVACSRRPRVAVLVTGTELRPPGEPLGPGEVYEANGPMLAAALEAEGCLVERLPAVADDEAAHTEAITRGLGADVLVTSGGVSVGPHDLVRAVEAGLGVEEVFWGVAVKPGKPVGFGVRGRTLVFGLPGNPVSSLVGFQLFVRPAVRALQGLEPAVPPLRPGVLAAPVRRSAEREQLLRARTRREDGRLLLEPVTGQDSHMIGRAAGADALVLVSRGNGALEAGAPVEYLPLGPG